MNPSFLATTIFISLKSILRITGEFGLTFISSNTSSDAITNKRYYQMIFGLPEEEDYDYENGCEF